MTGMRDRDKESFITMVWLLKWAFPLFAFIGVITTLTTEAEAGTNAGRIMGHYFQIVFSFGLISTGMGGFYCGRIGERLLSNYPPDFPQLKWSYLPWEAWEQVRRNWQIYKLVPKVDDAKIQQWLKMLKFWSYCICGSMLMVVPVGMIVFFILLGIMK